VDEPFDPRLLAEPEREPLLREADAPEREAVEPELLRVVLELLLLLVLRPEPEEELLPPLLFEEEEPDAVFERLPPCVELLRPLL
jgi:hypothetical protein